MKSIVFGILLFWVSFVSGQEKVRVVSLAPFITNSIYLLGGEKQLAGCTQYCLTGVKGGVPVVADAVNVNIEQIVSLKPDLVIAGELTHPRIIEAIRKMGIKTVHWYQPESFDEICTQLLELGRYLGKTELAERYIKESRERLAHIRAGIPSGRPLKMFLQVGANPLYTVLKNTFMDDYIVQLRGENIAAGLKTGVVSKEFVLLQNPDVMILTSMGMVGEDERREWMKYRMINAVKNGKVFLIDEYELCCPTPVTFVNALEKLAGQIYDLK